MLLLYGQVARWLVFFVGCFFLAFVVVVVSDAAVVVVAIVASSWFYEATALVRSLIHLLTRWQASFFVSGWCLDVVWSDWRADKRMGRRAGR